MTPRSGSGGFTLIEALLALATLALLASGVVTAVSFERRSWEVARTISALDAEIALRGHLRRWLEHASTEAWAAPLSGDDDALSFATAIGVESRPDVVILDVTVSIVAEPGGARAIALDIIGRDAEDAVVLRETRVLARGLASASLRYFGGGDGGAASWSDTWMGRDRPPRLVKIEARRLDASAWPPLAVRPAGTRVQSEISASSLLPPG